MAIPLLLVPIKSYGVTFISHAVKFVVGGLLPPTQLLLQVAFKFFQSQLPLFLNATKTLSPTFQVVGGIISPTQRMRQISLVAYRIFLSELPVGLSLTKKSAPIVHVGRGLLTLLSPTD